MADQQRRGDLHRGLGPEGLGRKKKTGREGNKIKIKRVVSPTTAFVINSPPPVISDLIT